MLYIVGIDIGNPDDLTLRAARVLKSCPIWIAEEIKTAGRLITQLKPDPRPQIFLFNEHHSSSDVDELVALCLENEVALFTDAGMPGVFDPGHQLVSRLHQKKSPVKSIPGVSSLTTFLSLCGVEMKSYNVAGFPPQDTGERKEFFKLLLSRKQRQIVFDTPYRLKRILDEVKALKADHEIVLGVNLSCDDERVYRGKVSVVAETLQEDKAPFVLMI